MCLYKPCLLHTVEFNSDLTAPLTRACKNTGSGCRWEGTNSLHVAQGLNLVKNFQVLKIVNIDFVLQNNHNTIPSQPHCPNLTSEWKLPNAPALEIIPNHDFVGRVTRILASPNKGQHIAPEKHLHNCDSSPICLPPECLHEWVTIVNPESRLRSTSKTAMVLIKSHWQQAPIMRLTLSLLLLILVLPLDQVLILFHIRWLLSWWWWTFRSHGRWGHWTRHHHQNKRSPWKLLPLEDFLGQIAKAAQLIETLLNCLLLHLNPKHECRHKSWQHLLRDCRHHFDRTENLQQDFFTGETPTVTADFETNLEANNGWEHIPICLTC